MADYTDFKITWFDKAGDPKLGFTWNVLKRGLIDIIETEKDQVYHERNMLVAALSKMYPSYLGLHPKHEEWEEDWRTIVFIELPTGQATWHIHDSEKRLFHHLDFRADAKWDGHTTGEKYVRLAKL